MKFNNMNNLFYLCDNGQTETCNHFISYEVSPYLMLFQLLYVQSTLFISLLWRNLKAVQNYKHVLWGLEVFMEVLLVCFICSFLELLQKWFIPRALLFLLVISYEGHWYASSCSEVLAVESLDKPLTVFREERFPHDSTDGLFYSLGPPRALVFNH